MTSPSITPPADVLADMQATFEQIRTAQQAAIHHLNCIGQPIINLDRTARHLGGITVHNMILAAHHNQVGVLTPEGTLVPIHQLANPPTPFDLNWIPVASISDTATPALKAYHHAQTFTLSLASAQFVLSLLLLALALLQPVPAPGALTDLALRNALAVTALLTGHLLPTALLRLLNRRAQRLAQDTLPHWPSRRTQPAGEPTP